MVGRRGTTGVVPENWRRYAVFVLKGYGVLLSVLWLLVVGLLLAGYVVGPAPTPGGPATTIDVDEAPEDVAADAVAQLRTRDHTLEHRIVTENTTDGTVRGGLVYRARVNHSTERLRMAVYPTAFEEGYTTADAPRYEYYGTTFATWQRSAPGGSWQRTDRNVGAYSRDVSSVAGGPDVIRRSEAVLARENESVLVVEITDGPALDTFGEVNVTAERLQFVIEKGPTPHLARVAYSARDGDVAIRRTVEVTGVDATPIEHPDELPRARASGAFHRSLAGAERILGWFL